MFVPFDVYWIIWPLTFADSDCAGTALACATQQVEPRAPKAHIHAIMPGNNRARAADWKACTYQRLGNTIPGSPQNRDILVFSKTALALVIFKMASRRTAWIAPLNPVAICCWPVRGVLAP